MEQLKLSCRPFQVTTHSVHAWIAASGPKLLEANCEFDELLFHFVEAETVRRSIKRLSSDPLMLSSSPETQFAKLMRFRHLELQWGSQTLDVDEHDTKSPVHGDMRTVQVEVVGGGLFLDVQQVRALIGEADKLLAYAKGKLGRGTRSVSAVRQQPQRKKRPAVEQVRFSLEAFTVDFDRVMEFRVTTVEGNPKSDGRPDLAQVVPVHIEQVADQGSKEEDSSLPPFGLFGKEAAVPKAPPLPCGAVLALGKVVVLLESGVVRTKLERCHLDYREEGLPPEVSYSSLRDSSRGVSGTSAGSGQQERQGSASGPQQSRRTSQVQALDPTADRNSMLFGVQTAGVVYHKGVKGEAQPPRAYVSACGVDVAWEADAHLFLHAVGQDVKEVLDRRKEALKRVKRAAADLETGASSDGSRANGVGSEEHSNSCAGEVGAEGKGRQGGRGNNEGGLSMEGVPQRFGEDARRASQNGASTSGAAKRSPLLLHLDLEMLNVGADIGLGWQAFVRAQSVFSEDASIGVLLEGLQAGLNDAVVCSSNSLQLSRHPSLADGGGEGEAGPAAWDVLVQGSGTRLRMPFRMALREAEDAGEDTARALKYIVLAMKQGQAWYRQVATPNAAKKKKKGKAVGTVKLVLRDFQADIEDEPFQSWLDLHYRLLSKQVREALVREKLLAEKVGEAAAKELEQEARSFMAEPGQAEQARDESDLLNPALVSMQQAAQNKVCRLLMGVCIWEVCVLLEDSGSSLAWLACGCDRFGPGKFRFVDHVL